VRESELEQDSEQEKRQELELELHCYHCIAVDMTQADGLEWVEVMLVQLARDTEKVAEEQLPKIAAVVDSPMVAADMPVVAAVFGFGDSPLAVAAVSGIGDILLAVAVVSAIGIGDILLLVAAVFGFGNILLSVAAVSVDNLYAAVEAFATVQIPWAVEIGDSRSSVAAVPVSGDILQLAEGLKIGNILLMVVAGNLPPVAVLFGIAHMLQVAAADWDYNPRTAELLGNQNLPVDKLPVEFVDKPVLDSLRLFGKDWTFD